MEMRGQCLPDLWLPSPQREWERLLSLLCILKHLPCKIQPCHLHRYKLPQSPILTSFTCLEILLEILWKPHTGTRRIKNAERHRFGAFDEPGLGQETTDPQCNWRLGEVSGGRHVMQMGNLQAAGTSPEGPTVSARMNAKSPLPQHRSTTTSPGWAPLHLMAMRFQTLCCPRLSMLLSCKEQTHLQYGLHRPSIIHRVSPRRPGLTISEAPVT